MPKAKKEVTTYVSARVTAAEKLTLAVLAAQRT